MTQSQWTLSQQKPSLDCNNFSSRLISSDRRILKKRRPGWTREEIRTCKGTLKSYNFVAIFCNIVTHNAVVSNVISSVSKCTKNESGKFVPDAFSLKKSRKFELDTDQTSHRLKWPLFRWLFRLFRRTWHLIRHKSGQCSDWSSLGFICVGPSVRSNWVWSVENF